MKRLISLAMMVAALAVTGAFGQVPIGPTIRTWYTNDGSPAFRIKNSGTELVSITVGTPAAVVTITNGSAATTFQLDPSTTNLGTLANAIGAWTNSSGVKTLTIDTSCSLASDIVSNNIRSGITFIPANVHTFVDGPKWITSNVLFYTAFVPSQLYGGVGNAKKVRTLFADLGGTGNITITGYMNGQVVYSKAITSPVYVNGQYWFQAGTSTNVTDNVGPGEFNLDLNLPVGQGDPIMFRATRATTGTTGGFGLAADLVP